MTRTERIPRLGLLEKPVLSAAEACAISGFGLTTIYDATKDGSLPSLRRGRSLRIMRDDLDAWLKRLSTPSRRKTVVENGVTNEKPPDSRHL